MAVTQTAEAKEAPRDEQREYRLEMFKSLKFTQKEAEKLADAKNAKGFPVDWHFVRRALTNGLSHKTAVKLLT